MGLDITAFRRAELCSNDEPCSHMHHFHVYSIPEFVERLDGFVQGRYGTNANDPFDFRAGSYGGYNRWRAELSLQGLGVAPEAVWESWGAYRGRPFAELVNMADNEGALGPKTSAKLLADFKAMTPHGDEYFNRKYAEWTKALEIAADRGFVLFQ